ncbi:putative pentatricopeptide repeat-containing protein [Panicum miliaceum]|uniref:Pentatricopeptide repeat-containing protein n=1 Tax=Panicum miliaceum TaxID=4540 RepID=A0A3L6SVI2_PANMI|nr:putative pentatricopeptide repeat-containing protein [Panicum miliaceum]
MPRRGCPPDVVTYSGMCAAGEFLEADQVLNEMVFEGFAPTKDGVRKFVQGIERGGDAALLESVLCRLAKVDALESSGWEKAGGQVGIGDPAGETSVCGRVKMMAGTRDGQHQLGASKITI